MGKRILIDRAELTKLLTSVSTALHAVASYTPEQWAQQREVVQGRLHNFANVVDEYVALRGGK